LVQRLNAVSEVEKSIGNLLRHAQTCISELSKEKQISKSKMEESSQAFKKTLTQVEKELSEQMLYLSNVCVGSAHQGRLFVEVFFSKRNATFCCYGWYHSIGRIGVNTPEERTPPPSGTDANENDDEVQELCAFKLQAD
uniref:Mediator of RNA polymerase II transcription subunit 11 n=1 Tax=Heligmosomoides polygyrus TaxID=6339 RepID=A0A183FJV9_HELPZ